MFKKISFLALSLIFTLTLIGGITIQPNSHKKVSTPAKASPVSNFASIKNRLDAFKNHRQADIRYLANLKNTLANSNKNMPTLTSVIRPFTIKNLQKKLKQADENDAQTDEIAQNECPKYFPEVEHQS